MLNQLNNKCVRAAQTRLALNGDPMATGFCNQMHTLLKLISIKCDLARTPLGSDAN
jgi:hypothetical protein